MLNLIAGGAVKYTRPTYQFDNTTGKSRAPFETVEERTASHRDSKAGWTHVPDVDPGTKNCSETNLLTIRCERTKQ